MTMANLPEAGQIALIERSYPHLLALTPSVAERFYQRLARDFPELFALFKDAEPAGQQQKLLAAMTLLVTNLHRPELLQAYFQALGERHQQYGVTEAMLSPFITTWLKTIEGCLSDANVPAVVEAWDQLLTFVADLMMLSPQPKPTNQLPPEVDTKAQQLIENATALFSQQQQLITTLSVTATREVGGHTLLADLAKLRANSNELQSLLLDVISSTQNK